MSQITVKFNSYTLRSINGVLLTALLIMFGGCKAYGHSCFGGHGKRSDPDGQTQSLDADPVGVKVENWDSSNDVMRLALSSEEVRQLRDFVECRNRAIELSRRTRTQPNYMPLLIGKWLTSCRHPYNTNSETNNK